MWSSLKGDGRLGVICEGFQEIQRKDFRRRGQEVRKEAFVRIFSKENHGRKSPRVKPGIGMKDTNDTGPVQRTLARDQERDHHAIWTVFSDEDRCPLHGHDFLLAAFWQLKRTRV